MTENTGNNSCPNCSNILDSTFEFCPNCGQANKKPDLHFKYFIREFIDGSFNIDSKIFRTLKLLVFHPGKLTKEFIAGRRKMYIPPVRLYLIMSLIFYTLLSFMNRDYLRVSDKGINNNQLVENDSLNTKQIITLDSNSVDSPEAVNSEKDSDKTSGLGNLLSKMSKKESKDEFNKRLPKYISIGMFILMPITALLFYLLFYKQTYYIEHLVFVLHLQSFMYVLFILFNLLDLILNLGWLQSAALIMFMALLAIWIKKYYEIGWLKTTWKAFLFVMMYGFVFVLFLAIVSVINLWLM